MIPISQRRTHHTTLKLQEGLLDPAQGVFSDLIPVSRGWVESESLQGPCRHFTSHYQEVSALSKDKAGSMAAGADRILRFRIHRTESGLDLSDFPTGTNLPLILGRKHVSINNEAFNFLLIDPWPLKGGIC